MPVLPAAEALLAARGVTVLPDVVVNSGTNAWWWTLFGDIGADADEAFAHYTAVPPRPPWPAPDTGSPR
jgi:glutamate dehydrogenase (NAD(P)+)